MNDGKAGKARNAFKSPSRTHSFSSMTRKLEASSTKVHPWEQAWKEGRWYEVSDEFPAVIEFADYLIQTGRRTVLDFGCGAGRHAVYLAKRGFSVVGFDISCTALKKLGERFRSASVEDVTIVRSDMSTLPFSSGVFDAVVSTNVLHHGMAKDIEEAVNETFRVMKPEAAGLLMTLSENDYKNNTGELLEPGTYVMTEGDEKGITHHFFSKEELLSLFRNFEIASLAEELVPIESGNRGHFHLRFKKVQVNQRNTATEDRTN